MSQPDVCEDIEPVLRSSPSFFGEEELPSGSGCTVNKSLLSENEGMATPRTGDKADLNDDDLLKMISAEEYLMDKSSCLLLDYERQMFLDMSHADALLVAAK